jgi:hypothetical protein
MMSGPVTRIGRIALGILALALASVGGGCSEDSPAAPAEPTPCATAVVITVGPGLTPEISWTPACLVHWLLIEPSGSSADNWGVVGGSPNSLGPPVTYGTVPSGAMEFQSPDPLIAGTQYDVYVTRWIGPNADDVELIGTQSFRP